MIDSSAMVMCKKIIKIRNCEKGKKLTINLVDYNYHRQQLLLDPTCVSKTSTFDFFYIVVKR